MFLMAGIASNVILYVGGERSQFVNPAFACTSATRVDFDAGLHLSQIPWFSAGVSFPVVKFNIFASAEGYFFNFPYYAEAGNKISEYTVGDVGLSFGIAREFGTVKAGVQVSSAYELLASSAGIALRIDAGALISPQAFPLEVGLGFQGVGLTFLDSPTACVFGKYRFPKGAGVYLLAGAEVSYTGAETSPLALNSISVSLSWLDKVGVGGSYGGLNTGILFYIKPLNFLPEKDFSFLPSLNLLAGYSFILGSTRMALSGSYIF